MKWLWMFTWRAVAYSLTAQVLAVLSALTWNKPIEPPNYGLLALMLVADINVSRVLLLSAFREFLAKRRTS